MDRNNGGIGSVVGRYPRESVGAVLAGAAVLAVFVNALFLQRGPHPAPIFATRPMLVAPAPASIARPQPAKLLSMPAPVQNPAPAQPPLNTMQQPSLSALQTTMAIQRELTRLGFYDGAADGIWGAKTDAGVRDFEQASGIRVNPEASDELLRMLTAARVKLPAAEAAAPPVQPRADPIATLIAPSRNVLAIQRALSDFGYGQIKPTGTYDPDTRTAIEKFERSRNLPVTGQISDRFVRELGAMTGRPLE